MQIVRIAAPLAILALAACQQAPEKKAPAADAAADQANASAVEGELAPYVGKTIFEPVAGAAFADNEQVQNALRIAVRTEEPRAWLLRRDTEQRPIVMQNNRLLAYGCERGNCGARNWTILIDPLGAMAEVCYHSGGRTRWYAGGRHAEERPGACPTS